MSFSGRTPESLLPRSDSKNPATTCRGITSTGRPCRRALATSPKNSPAPSPSRGAGVLAVLDESHAAAFYCWQHKDQAEQLAARDDRRTRLHALKEKSSIDTFIERVGILDLDDEGPAQQKRHRRRHPSSHGPPRRETLPSGWNEMQSPLMTVPEEIVRRRPPPPPKPRSPPPRSNTRLSWACCLQADDDDHDMPPPRVRPSIERRPSERGPMQSSRPEMRQSSDILYMPSIPQTPSSRATRPEPSATPSSHSHTQTLLSVIPSHLSPQTTSLLLAELSRPISPADEAGYIYIFWLTPETEASRPDDETASSLLDDDDDPQVSTARSQRTNQTLTRYASVRHAQSRSQPGPQRTITLKIGRAANVHRRMSQWTKQCGQNISLIRYYPYTGSSNHSHSRSTPIQGRKVPHVHRVERLIHLELAERRVVKSECGQCGREHREWFEIEASRSGLKGVDEVVRRWVAWAERQ
ncbi:hypothetical protein A1O1_08536 [Capronia coronata CBS 617.96]|uniref:Bacteriophage T5 Orf172 DNA-binding domain-containing protein n=1 Tax=Capronia coronata CBS 617.96 TaxID=1182541 RepID=W9XIS4_9EURO|nr:uncharacterized protein A1O1_08536 [Capronia coronata CBS 617.96]EXJ80392.1 hypothetical protein A1O1_08536 [Capronia coronata CBS 617.96]